MFHTFHIDFSWEVCWRDSWEITFVSPWNARRHRMWYAWMPAVVVQRLDIRGYPWIKSMRKYEKMKKYGYGSIPMKIHENTIFGGMNIHESQLNFDVNRRGTRFWHTAIWIRWMNIMRHWEMWKCCEETWRSFWSLLELRCIPHILPLASKWGLEELPDAQVWRRQLHLKAELVTQFIVEKALPTCDSCESAVPDGSSVPCFVSHVFCPMFHLIPIATFGNSFKYPLKLL